MRPKNTLNIYKNWATITRFTIFNPNQIYIFYIYTFIACQIYSLPKNYLACRFTVYQIYSLPYNLSRFTVYQVYSLSSLQIYSLPDL